MAEGAEHKLQINVIVISNDSYFAEWSFTTALFDEG